MIKDAVKNQIPLTTPIEGMSKGYFGIFASLARIGLYPFIIYLHIFLLVIFAADIIRLWINYPLIPALISTLNIFFEKMASSYFPPLKLFIFFFLTLPIVAGMLGVLFRYIPKRDFEFGGRHRNLVLVALNFIAATLIASCYIFGKSMEINSGYVFYLNNGKNVDFMVGFNSLIGTSRLPGFASLELNKSYEFTSFYSRFIEIMVFPFLKYFLEIFLLAGPWIIKQSDSLLSKTWLADLGSDCYPVHSNKFLNFNSADTAPVIRFVRKQRNNWLTEYEQLPPKSKEAEKKLMDCWFDSQTLLGRLMGLKTSIEKSRIRFFNEPGRAIETTLDIYPHPKRIITSPYEIQKLEDVLNWYANSNSCEKIILKPDPGFFDMEKENQIEKVAKDILREINPHSHPNTNNIIIMSEVCYATGQAIELEEIIQRIEQGYQEKSKEMDDKTNSICSPKFLIIGSYAVENLESLSGPFLGDAYVLSGDKWLMSPEPCGLALINKADFQFGTENPEVPNEPFTHKPYDCLDDKISITNVDPTKVAGLKSCLDLLSKFDNISNKVFTRRSHELRDLFWKDVKKYFSLVGVESYSEASRMITIKPSEQFKWKYPTATLLDNYLSNQFILAKVISFEANVPWVRLSFSFFHGYKDVQKLGKILKGAVVPIHEEEPGRD